MDITSNTTTAEQFVIKSASVNNMDITAIHYSNPSVWRSFKPSVDQNIASVTNATRNKPAQHKSAKKRQRDIDRLLEFRARKTACAMMPFHHISNDELHKILRKNQFYQPQQTTKLNALEKENRILKLKNEELFNCVVAVQKQQQIAEREVCIAEYKLEKCKMELNSVNEKLHSYDQSLLQQKDLQKEITEVKAQNLQLNSNISEDRNTILKLSEQNHILYKFLVDTLQLLSEVGSINVGLEDEYMTIVNQLYRGCEDVKPHNIKKFKCKRCGSSNYHHRSRCLANNNECSKCNKQNHFTSMCHAPVNCKQTLGNSLEELLKEMELETGVSALEIIDKHS